MEHSVRYSCLSLFTGLSLLLSGCSLNQKFEPEAQFVAVLPPELKESSALLCVEQDFISFNDSGGPSVLYRFDRSGLIRAQLELSFKNSDWEAITSDGNFLYLADTGNNAGQKQSLFIYKVPLNWTGLPQPYPAERLEIQLPPDQKRQPYQHDLDFEALVYQQGVLWLISKSWQSQIPAAYQLDPKLAVQKLGQAIPFAPPGFLVTDAVFDQNTAQWWLVGYTDPRKAIWAFLTQSGFQAQIARYDKNLLLLESRTLPTTGQVEGLCIDENKQIWISEEGSAEKPAQFMATGLNAQ